MTHMKYPTKMNDVKTSWMFEMLFCCQRYRIAEKKSPYNCKFVIYKRSDQFENL